MSERSRTTIAYRAFRLHPGILALGVALLVAALAASGCSFMTHLACHGGREGTCAVDCYGVLTTVRHVDIPVREIVEVSVDERVSRRRRGDSATMEIVTRSMGRIDLAGRPLLGGSFATDDAVHVAKAMRELLQKGASPPRDVDLWVGPPPIVGIGALALTIFFAFLFAALVKFVLGDVARIRVVCDREAGVVRLFEGDVREVPIADVAEVVIEEGFVDAAKGDTGRVVGWRLALALRDGTRVPVVQDYRVDERSHQRACARLAIALDLGS